MANAVCEFPHVMGDDDGPLAADHYKRAVHRPAPNRFAIEFLPPAKIGGSGSYSHGMRVSPISRGDRGSMSSNGSNFEYDVWRRWEDCLWFQDGLEIEYQRSARQKRQRLLQGKGVKKNGFYLQDQASSWESLPPGPDPNSVARDIHAHIPKLTKRGSIFRASMATIEQRDIELQAFVEALFREDQPALIKEMRSTRLVTDFFGYWHRDVELTSKKQKSKARESLTPSIFSSYFSTSSTPSLLDSSNGKSPKSQPYSPLKRPFLRARASTTSSERPHSIASSQLTETPMSTTTSGRTSSDNFMSSSASSVTTVRCRASSVTSSSGSSSSQDDHSDTVCMVSIPKIAEEVPVIFGHNPQRHSNPQSRPASILEALPEESDGVVIPFAQHDFMRKKPNGLNQRRNRNGQIFVSPTDSSSSTSLDSPQSPTEKVMPTKGYAGPTNTQVADSASDRDRSVRNSWATIDSTSTYLEGLHIELPASPMGYRNSMASIKTIMTTNSAEAVLPRTPPPFDIQDKLRPNPRASVPVSLSDFDMYPEIPEDDEISSIYDAFPRPASFVPERPETPVPHNVVPHLNIPEPRLRGPPLPTTSVSTTSSAFSASTATSTSTVVTSSTSSSGDGNTLSIKAALENSIVMLRASRDIEFSELRRRIFNKFVGQEGVPLSKDFTVAVVVAQAKSPIAQLREPATETRKHSFSVASLDNSAMRIVDCQGDWETVAYSTEGTKLTLHILNTPT